MFHVRVADVSERRMSELVPVEEGDTEHDFMEVFREPLDRECVEFSVGNPRVEHITGIVHLYKRNAGPDSSSSTPYGLHQPQQQQPWKGPAAAAAAAAELEEASLTLCCLAIPADMSVANFCTFIGAYLREVRSIQVLRREGSQPSVCMVLLTFAAQEQADGFYADFNAVPFSSLEPDILCRLVFVRDVEVLSSRGRPPSVTLPAAAAALTVATSTQPGSSLKEAAAAKPGSSPKKAAAAADAAAGKPGSSPKAAATTSEEAAASAQQPGKGAADASQQGSEPAGPSEQQQGKQPSAGSSSSATQAGAPEGGPSYAAAVSGAATPPTATTPTASSAAASAATAAATAAAGSQQWLEPPPGTTELPTCPVCLERLDEHISGIVTTVCNHRFHGECLKHWGDTSCPVCRYCMLSSNTSTSRCNTCGAHTNLWICLICGHVGCGRYKQGHANDHWQASAHCYALELETQRVWDYAGDGYVHRLIQSKTDGKLVEVPSPAPTCSHGSPGHHHHHRSSRCSHQAGGRPGGSSSRTGLLGRSHSGSSAAAAGGGGACSSGAGDVDDDDGGGEACGDASCPVCADEAAQMKEAMVTSKLEVITLEYNHLLASQLDSQRQYFEGLLAQHDAKQQGALAASRAAAEAAQASSAAAAASAKESERKRQQLERKLAELTSSISKVSEEREFLRSLNETLLSNQKEFSSKLQAAQAEAAAKDAQLLDLQEQVRDLMIFIEAQRTIQAEGGSELQDATLLPMLPSKGGGRGGSRRTSKK